MVADRTRTAVDAWLHAQPRDWLAQVATVAARGDRFWVVLDAWVHGRSIVSPRLFLPLQYAVIAIECAFLAWSASQSVGTWPQIPSAERHQYHIGEDEVPTVSSSAAASGNVV